jgi:ABC-type dipeptide/oligopeptide/nickel transport system permease subunit
MNSSIKFPTSPVTLSAPSELIHAPHHLNLPHWRWRVLRRRIMRYGEGVIAGILLTIIVLSVVFAQHLTSYSPTAGMSLRDRFKPPFWQEGGTIAHPLGTDNLGRDLLTRTLYGGQVSLGVAFIASTAATLIGASLGLICGYLGGFPDRLLRRLTEFWVSFPFLVLALAVIAVVGSSPVVLIILMSLSGWVYPAQVTRAQTLKMRELDYVQASIALGASSQHVIRFHIFPSIISVNIVVWTLSFGALVLVESSLSFIGLGVSPPTPSWGNMLNDSKTYLQDAWWMSVMPGLALMMTILCVNTVGDALQKFSSRHLYA